MASIGALVFCTDCGNILPMSTGSSRNMLVCRCCGAENRGMASSWTWRGQLMCCLRADEIDTSSAKVIVTESKPRDFPSPLRQKLSLVQSVELHKVKSGTVTTETCPKCGRTEVRYTTAQTRGADEGSTVFFNCDCGHRCVLDDGDGCALTIVRLLTNGQVVAQQLKSFSSQLPR